MFNKLLPIKVTPEQYTLLKTTAQEQQTTMATLVRQALDKELAALRQRNLLSNLAQISELFPEETRKKTDDELIYDL